MKLKHTLTIIVVLITAFITVQSFRYGSKKRSTVIAPSYFKPLPGNARLCVAIYDPADSLADIPALKGWGHYQWKISNASDSAQFYFNQGINLYYAFHTIESIASFTKATHIDPNCAMAWYGKALAMGPTINYPNGYRPPSDAFEAAVKSKQLSANCTSVEKDLIEAIQHRYSADTTAGVKQLRMNYADAMQKIYATHPKNAEVVTLYADALLLLHPWDLYAHDFTPKPWTPKIRSLLEQALTISPKHPGANHYYIHTMEASATPGTALKSANILDTLMPQVSHLTHMPSHIYIRTGDYQKGIKNNEAAVAGYNSYLKQYAPSANGFPLYALHNEHLRINCAQMAGNYKTSIDGSKELQAQIPAEFLTAPGADGNYIQYIYAQPTFTNLRFGKWDDILKMPVADTLAYAAAIQHFARGIAYSRKGDAAMAKKELKILDKLAQSKLLEPAMDNFSSAKEASGVAILILQGVIAEDQQQYAAAIGYLQKAVIAEDHIIYNEPRDWAIPARQYLANVLIKAGKYNEAIGVLKHDLVINPHNGWSLIGLQLAYEHTNNTAGLKKVKTQLKDAWKIRDVEIERPVF